MRAVAAVSLASLGFLLACGGRSLDVEIERHPANVLPQGATQVFYARVDRLRDNPLAVLACERAQKLDLGTFKSTSQTLALAGDVERLVLGTYGATVEKEAAAVVVATGRFNEDVFRKALETFRMPHVEGSYGDRRFYTCGRGETRCYVSFVSPRLLAVASQEDLLKRTLALSKRGTKSMARDRGFAPLLQSFSPEMDLWATGLFPPVLSAAFGGQLQAAVQLIQAFTLKLAGQERKHLDLVLHCGSVEAAQANAMVLKTLLGATVQQLVDGGYNVADLIDAVNRSQIIVEGGTADFKLEMNKAEIAATAAVLRAEPVAPAIEAFPPAAAPER